MPAKHLAHASSTQVDVDGTFLSIFGWQFLSPQGILFVESEYKAMAQGNYSFDDVFCFVFCTD